MKKIQLDRNIILDYFLKEIRPVLEYAAPVWSSGISVAQSNQIERVQKVALRIILGHDYSSYSEACSEFNVESLRLRRETLCGKFAVKLFQSDRRRQFYDEPLSLKSTRNSLLVHEQVSRTRRCHNAPHNSLARIINANVHRLRS